MTLKIRFLLSLIVYTILVLSLFGGTYYIFERRAAIKAQREEQVKTLEKLRTVCRDSSAVTANPITAVNYVKAVKSDPAIVFASCVDANGLVLAHSDPQLGGRRMAPEQYLSLLQSAGAANRSYSFQNGLELVQWDAPVFLGTRRVGLAQVAYDQGVLKREIQAKLKETLEQFIVVAGCTFLLAVFFGLALAENLTRPIALLVKAARAIGGGNLDHQTKLLDRRDELGYLAQEMNAMARRLKALDELKDEFISHVSHELRNPMAAIKMFAQEMLNGSESQRLSAAQREMLAMIEDNAVKLNLFVSNVLDAAKMKAGLMEYHLQDTPLEPVFRSVQALFQLLAAQKKIELSCELTGNISSIRADPQRLEQALNNLVSNALKFTRSGGRVAMGARHNKGLIEIYVSDNGYGITAQGLRDLFKPFHQAAAASQIVGRIQGSGLGLYIIKQTVEAMGGKVAVRSEPGKGSLFSLLFPANLRQ